MQKIDFVNSTQPALNDTNLNLMQDYIESAINAQVSGDTLPIGTVLPYAGTTIPDNWLLCDGSAISRATYSQLFNVIGTTYGSGDGSTTFNLPNFKGKVPVGQDTTQSEFDTLGETGGEKTHTLTISEIPTHDHNVSKSSDIDRLVLMAKAQNNYGNASNGTGSGDWQWNRGVPAQGGGQAHNNLQPYIVQKYIIKANQTAGTVAQIANARSTSSSNAYSCSYINDLHTYSTTEKRVGTWTDGRPVYEITITATKVSETDYQYALAPNSGVIDNAWVVEGYLKSTSGTFYNLDRVEHSGDYIYTRSEIEGRYFKYKSSTGNYTNGQFMARIRYTKTTD